MRRVVITDLTRFSNPDIVCIAAIDEATGECLRPMPYLKSAKVVELNIHPGAILEGNLTVNNGNSNPHLEDSSYTTLKYLGAAASDDFKSILDRTLSNSVSSGFGVTFADGQKHIPVGVNANCSIITIKIPPTSLHIHEDQYKPGKIKASFTDGAGQSFRYLSITDRGFFDFAKNHQDDGQLSKVQLFLLTQEELYLRIGVSRQWKLGERDGYWLQVNGIYTFPDFFDEIRTYV
ncbi:MAG TPA: hypothetical protein ENJ28_10450 [Gammaproteobacteria bacterium]|nr:hypothetical protein [Gammaproteobacteria bacterium]